MSTIKEPKEVRALTDEELREVTGGFDLITIFGHTITLGDVKDAVVAVVKKVT
jgi:hypothetical protein